MSAWWWGICANFIPLHKFDLLTWVALYTTQLPHSFSTDINFKSVTEITFLTPSALDLPMFFLVWITGCTIEVLKGWNIQHSLPVLFQSLNNTKNRRYLLCQELEIGYLYDTLAL